MSTPLNAEFMEVLVDALEKVSTQKLPPLEPSTTLRATGLDSVALAEALVMLEDAWDINLEFNDLAKAKTIAELQEMVLQARGQK